MDFINLDGFVRNMLIVVRGDPALPEDTRQKALKIMEICKKQPLFFANLSQEKKNVFKYSVSHLKADEAGSIKAVERIKEVAASLLADAVSFHDAENTSGFSAIFSVEDLVLRRAVCKNLFCSRTSSEKAVQLFINNQEVFSFEDRLIVFAGLQDVYSGEVSSWFLQHLGDFPQENRLNVLLSLSSVASDRISFFHCLKVCFSERGRESEEDFFNQVIEKASRRQLESAVEYLPSLGIESKETGLKIEEACIERLLTMEDLFDAENLDRTIGVLVRTSHFKRGDWMERCGALFDEVFDKDVLGNLRSRLDSDSFSFLLESFLKNSQLSSDTTKSMIQYFGANGSGNSAVDLRICERLSEKKLNFQDENACKRLFLENLRRESDPVGSVRRVLDREGFLQEAVVSFFSEGSFLEEDFINIFRLVLDKNLYRLIERQEGINASFFSWVENGRSPEEKLSRLFEFFGKDSDLDKAIVDHICSARCYDPSAAEEVGGSLCRKIKRENYLSVMESVSDSGMYQGFVRELLQDASARVPFPVFESGDLTFRIKVAKELARRGDVALLDNLSLFKIEEKKELDQILRTAIFCTPYSSGSRARKEVLGEETSLRFLGRAKRIIDEEIVGQTGEGSFAVKCCTILKDHGKELFSDSALGRLCKSGKADRQWVVLLDFFIKKCEHGDLFSPVVKALLENMYAERFAKVFESFQKKAKGQDFWQGEHLFALAVYPSLWAELPEAVETKSAIETLRTFWQEKSVRDAFNKDKGFLSLFVEMELALEQSELSADRKLLILAKICGFYPVDPNWKRSSTEKLLGLALTLCRRGPVKELANGILSEGDLEEGLSSLFNESLESDPLFAGTGRLTERYPITFGKTRIPCALEMYKNSLKGEGEEVQRVLRRFVKSILAGVVFASESSNAPPVFSAGSFVEERYRISDNSHLLRIAEEHPAVFLKWSLFEDRSAVERIEDREYSIVDTDDWQDLLLSGTEIEGSCLSVRNDSEKSRCLLAYLLDGKNRMMAVKDPNNGKIHARAMLRLLWAKGGRSEGPVLLLDGIYPMKTSEPIRKALVSAALKRAAHLGIPLVSKAENVLNTLPEECKTEPDCKEAVSLGSPCPYDYVDEPGRGPKAGGEFSIRDFKLIIPD